MVFRGDRSIFQKFTRARPLGLAVALALLVPGCASAPRDIAAKPDVEASEAPRVEMLVATTRHPSTDPGVFYSGERGAAISFDRVVVATPARRGDADPQQNFSVVEAKKFQSESEIRGWVRRNRTAKRRALIYVHGFNTTHAEAVLRLAQIVRDGGVEAAPTLFSWPSRGGVFDYLYDKESANYSREALETLIVQASAGADVEDVTILAHSMGCWLTMEALRAVALKKGGVPGAIHNVVLASPDLDIDVFRRQWLEMGPRPPHFTLITSSHDKALDLSRWLSGGIDRVGGVDLTPYRAMLASLNISVVDTSAVETADPLGHEDFAASPEIVRLIGRQFAGRDSAEGAPILPGAILRAAAGAVSRASAAPPGVPHMAIQSGQEPTPALIPRVEMERLRNGEIAY